MFRLHCASRTAYLQVADWDEQQTFWEKPRIRPAPIKLKYNTWMPRSIPVIGALPTAIVLYHSGAVASMASIRFFATLSPEEIFCAFRPIGCRITRTAVVERHGEKRPRLRIVLASAFGVFRAAFLPTFIYA